MSEPLDEQYLTWLYSQVGSVKLKNPSRTYWSLLRQLFTKEFVWIIPNDDNRVEDGRDLRYEFLRDAGIKRADADWLGLECSILEMLIGLSRRLSFEDEKEADPRWWFWKLLENLGLSTINDRQYDELYARGIDETLDRIVWRTYNHNGEGGLFPLRYPEEDQKDVEIWYQMSAYLLEHT